MTRCSHLVLELPSWAKDAAVGFCRIYRVRIAFTFVVDEHLIFSAGRSHLEARDVIRPLTEAGEALAALHIIVPIRVGLAALASTKSKHIFSESWKALALAGRWVSNRQGVRACFYSRVGQLNPLAAPAWTEHIPLHASTRWGISIVELHVQQRGTLLTSKHEPFFNCHGHSWALGLADALGLLLGAGENIRVGALYAGHHEVVAQYKVVEVELVEVSGCCYAEEIDILRLEVEGKRER